MGASSSKESGKKKSSGSWFSWGSTDKKKKKCPAGEHRDKVAHKCVKDAFSDYSDSDEESFSDYPDSEKNFKNGSGSEPEWTKKIPSWLICDWFFLLFSMNAVILVLLLLSIIYMTVSSTLPKNMRATTLFMLVTQLLVSGTGTLFYYLICDRSLKPT
jgi:hypothetical protein